MMDSRTADMYRAHQLGATLEEAGRPFNISRERVRQIFQDEGLPARDRAAAHAARHARAHARARALMATIRDLRAEGVPERDIAKRYGLTLDAVRQVSRP